LIEKVFAKPQVLIFGGAMAVIFVYLAKRRGWV
jgi:hypothetical protein